MIDDRGLVEVSVPGGATRVRAPASGFCAADPRREVIWFAGKDRLAVLDLRDDTIHDIVVPARGGALPSEISVEDGDGALGHQERFYEVRLEVTLGAKPALDAELGCDGDMAYACYSNPLDPKTLSRHIAAELAAAKKLRFADPAYLKALIARAGPPPAPASAPAGDDAEARAAVPESVCGDISGCGHAIGIPGSPLFVLRVGEEQGDYLERWFALWSPARGELIYFDGDELARTRSAKDVHPAHNMWDHLWVSAHGTISLTGHLLVGERDVFTPQGLGRSCGFVGASRLVEAD
jgi:hypothetical protein